jgi:small subunit ribosomal protein S8
MFSNIKNGQIANRSFIYQEKKNFCEAILKILWTEGYILGYEKKNNKFKIYLKYIENRPVINNLNSISKPGKRIYFSIKQIWKLDSSKYFIIFSTNKGLKTILECKKLKIGGEPLFVIN